MNTQTVGTCSICGGAVTLPTVPSAAWWAVVTVVWVPGLVTLIAWLIWGHQ